MYERGTPVFLRCKLKNLQGMVANATASYAPDVKAIENNEILHHAGASLIPETLILYPAPNPQRQLQLPVRGVFHMSEVPLYSDARRQDRREQRNPAPRWSDCGRNLGCCVTKFPSNVMKLVA